MRRRLVRWVGLANLGPARAAMGQARDTLPARQVPALTRRAGRDDLGNDMIPMLGRLAARLTALVLTALLVVGPQFMTSGMAAGLPTAGHHDHHDGRQAGHHDRQQAHHHDARGECCDSCAACPICLAMPGLAVSQVPAVAGRPGLSGLDIPLVSLFHNTHRLPFPNGPPSILA